MEIIAEDEDLLSPDDLIDVIFACNTTKANQNNFSQPQTFRGAFRIAEITLSYCVRYADDEVCNNALRTDGFGIPKGIMFKGVIAARVVEYR